MLKEGFHGFCMALADSVPGVSGGTIAFIMGFYDSFIGSIDDLVFGRMKKKKTALLYLYKPAIGWVAGMILAVLILSSLFESHIYIVSSLFIGFIVGSIPLILTDELTAFRQMRKGLPFGFLGLFLVVGITWLNSQSPTAAVNLGAFSIPLAIRLFFTGMIAISAMFLPGISGSTLLLILGAYLPVITAIKGLLSLQLAYFPGFFVFGCGILAGAVSVVKGIRICLDRFRPQAVYAILGMMIGSFYAILMGPTTLAVPRAPLGSSNFHIPACVAGIVLVLALQMIREKKEKRKEDTNGIPNTGLDTNASQSRY